MMKKWLAAAAALALCAGTALAQEGQPPRADEDEDLTPEKAMKLLKDAHGLMVKSEELLNDSSRGKALETEKALVERLKELLKDEAKNDPALLQKKVLEKIERLMKKSEGSQRETVEKLGEIIRKAKS